MNLLTQINDFVTHSPIGVIAMLFAMCLGYVLKAAAFFPNRFIPLVVVSVTAAVYALIRYCHYAQVAGSHPALFVVYNFVVGFIYGTSAWLIHAQFLKKFLDPHIFNDDGSTKFFTKSNTPKP